MPFGCENVVVHRDEAEGCHSEPKRSEGEESRPTKD